jgi:hypothetical protein
MTWTRTMWGGGACCTAAWQVRVFVGAGLWVRARPPSFFCWRGRWRVLRLLAGGRWHLQRGRCAAGGAQLVDPTAHHAHA